MKQLSPKYFLGPMTYNIIDAVIEYSNETGIPFGFIPSRRQIDWDGGYVGFTIFEFIKYVKKNSKHIIIERDHGGIAQGVNHDNGIISIYEDAKAKIDLIHIDPWKWYTDDNYGLKETLDIINFVIRINSRINFEIGTEEAIEYFSENRLDNLLFNLKKNLGNNFKKIKYAVIQSGTRLVGIQNTGKFKLDRLKKMIKVCKKFGILSKEHNGDYLTANERNIRFDNGLDSINIAPELGVFETKLLISDITKEKFKKIFDICYNGRKWIKWVPHNFEPLKNKKEIIEIAGHYHNKEIKRIVRMNDNLIKEKIKKKLEAL